MTVGVLVEVHIVEVLRHLTLVVQSPHILAIVICNFGLSNSTLVWLSMILILVLGVLLHTKRLFLKINLRKQAILRNRRWSR